MLTQQELHERVLYPVVRIRTQKAGGSGVLVYSQPDPKKPGKWLNIALSCHHVLDDAITVKEDWDGVLKQQRKKDFFAEVQAEVFDYDGSKIVSANATQADIIAYDAHHDMAAIRLHNSRRMPFVATMIPEDRIDVLKLFDPVFASGASLLHEPFATDGRITFLREVIDQKEFLMTSASSIFGASCGALIHAETGQLLGLICRVTAIQLGFGVDVLAWMNFSSHPKRLYEFFRDQELQFLYDSGDNYYDAMDRRERRRKDALRSILLGEDNGNKDERGGGE